MNNWTVAMTNNSATPTVLLEFEYDGTGAIVLTQSYDYTNSTDIAKTQVTGIAVNGSTAKATAIYMPWNSKIYYYVVDGNYSDINQFKNYIAIEDEDVLYDTPNAVNLSFTYFTYFLSA